MWISSLISLEYYLSTTSTIVTISSRPYAQLCCALLTLILISGFVDFLLGFRCFCFFSYFLIILNLNYCLHIMHTLYDELIDYLPFNRSSAKFLRLNVRLRSCRSHSGTHARLKGDASTTEELKGHLYEQGIFPFQLSSGIYYNKAR